MSRHEFTPVSSLYRALVDIEDSMDCGEYEQARNIIRSLYAMPPYVWSAMITNKERAERAEIEVRHANDMCGLKDARIADLEHEVQVAREHINILEDDLSDESDNVAFLERKLSSLEHAAQEFAASRDAAREALDKNLQAFNDLQERHDLQSKSMHTAMQQRDEAWAETRRIAKVLETSPHTELAELKTQNRVLDSEVKWQRNVITERVKQLEELTAARNIANADRERALRRVDKLEERLDGVREALDND
jgi:chromosome segregation ATPase